MKSVSRNKFLHCFRPMVDMGIESNSSDTDGSSDLGFSCIGLEDKKDVKTLDSNSGVVPRPPKRTLSRVLKAVLFETILTKRVGDRKGFRQESRRKGRSLDLGSDESSHEIKRRSLSSSSLSSSSSSSSSSSESKCLTRSLSVSSKKNHKNHQEQSEVNSKERHMDAIFLLLISLTITVLWGKLFAIILTIIWIYFVPFCSSGSRRKDYKKKVIMEGLLGRNHHCRGY